MRLTINVDDALHRQLLKAAAQGDRSLSREAVRRLRASFNGSVADAPLTERVAGNQDLARKDVTPDFRKAKP
jgi:hypothetical protein